MSAPGSDIVEKSFDFAQDATKQIISLAAAVLTITVTFHEDLEKSTGPRPASWPLQVSWVCYVVSIFAGVLTLAALTGTLGRQGDKPSISNVSIYRLNVRHWARLQLAAFVVGISLTAVFAWWSLS